MKQYNGPMRFAHRGFNKVAPENTLHAHSAAIEAGFEGIEIDIRMSKDGKIVVIHDENLTRMTIGHPTPCINAVKDMTWEELSKIELPYANHLLDEFPEGGFESEVMAIYPVRLLGQDSRHYYVDERKKETRVTHLSLLEDLVRWFDENTTTQMMEIEYKAPGMMDTLAPILEKAKSRERLILFSGVPEYINEIQDYYRTHGKPEGLKLGANIRRLDDKMKEYIKDMDLWEVGLNDRWFGEEEKAYLDARGIKIFSNLGDYPAWWTRVCELGVAGFKSNYPEEFTKWWQQSKFAAK